MGLVFDLNKALDKSKLVQVQVTVNGKNGTFQRMQWKNPADVKSTDKVVGNQAVLDAFRQKQQQAAQQSKAAAGKFDQNTWNAFKVANDRKGALDYLKQCGVTWKEDASNPGINWMRACMAASKAANGAVTVGGSNSANSGSTSKQPTKALDTSGITGFDTMDGKAKLKALLAKGKNTRDDLTAFAQSAGLNWTSTDKNGNPLPEGIAWMRCAMALQKYLDGKNLADLSSDVQATTTQTQQQPAPAPKPVDDKIEITASMTPRQVNLANLINGITDEDELELIKKSHVVAEDDKARTYIKDIFFKAWEDWKNGVAAKGNTYRSHYSIRSIAKSTADELGTLFTGVSKKVLRKGLEGLLDSNTGGISIANLLYPTDTMSAGAGSRWRVCRNISQSDSDTPYDVNGMTVPKLFSQLDAFSTLATNDNLRTCGIYSTTYDADGNSDPSKHGFNLVLDKIATEVPSTKSEVDRIKKCYSDILSACGGNPSAFFEIMHLDDYNEFETKLQNNTAHVDAYKLYYDCLMGVKKKYDLNWDDMNDLVKRVTGFRSDSTIYKDGKPLTDSRGNDIKFDISPYESDFVAKHGKKVSSFVDMYYEYNAMYALASMVMADVSIDDMTSDFDANLSKIKSSVGTNTSLHLPSYYFTNFTERNLYVQSYSQTITEQSYCKVKSLLLEMYGQKPVKLPSGSSTWDDVDTSNWSAKDWDTFLSGRDSSTGDTFACKKISDNEELDTVFANLQYIIANKSLLNGIHDNIIYGTTSSKANNQGSNYDANFDYFAPDGQYAGNGLLYGTVSSNKKHTADELNAKVAEQLKNAPVLTTEQLRQLRKFVDSNGTGAPNTSNPGGIGNTLAKAKSLDLTTESSLTAFKGTPMYDMIAHQLQCVSRYCPQMKTARVNTTQKLFDKVASKLGYTPYKDPSTQSTQQPAALTPADASKLKRLREEALAVANCSLASATDAENAQLETRVKHDWDRSTYHSDKKYHQGQSRIYSHLKAVFGGGAYKINNSGNQERFDQIRQKTGETPVSLFHGTNRSGACGITCVDNQFSWTVSGARTAGRLLGDGVYLADLVGKSAGYFGDWNSGVGRYGKQGCLLICDALLGREFTADSHEAARRKNNPKHYDTVSMKAGTAMNGGSSTRLRADEWCVNDADRVSPQYIIDMRTEMR